MSQNGTTNMNSQINESVEKSLGNNPEQLCSQFRRLRTNIFPDITTNRDTLTNEPVVESLGQNPEQLCSQFRRLSTNTESSQMDESNQGSLDQNPEFNVSNIISTLSIRTIRRRQARQQLTPEQRQIQNERRRMLDNQLSPELRNERLLRRRNRDANNRLNQTTQQTIIRRTRRRTYMQSFRLTRDEDERERHLAERRNRRSNCSEETRNQALQRRNAQRRARVSKTYCDAYNHHTEFDETKVEEHSCGSLDNECQYCGSLNFQKELPPDKKYTRCCAKGKVKLKPIKVNNDIKKLLKKQDPLSNNFIENIRSYNSALAFASMGAKVSPPPGHGPYCFRVHGQIYHRSPIPPIYEPNRYASLYILDSADATEQRMGINENSKCDLGLMKKLDTIIRKVNPFAKSYKMLYQLEKEEKDLAALENREVNQIKMTITKAKYADRRRYNVPTASEIAIVFHSADGAPPFERDIRVVLNVDGERKFEQISVLNPCLDALTYPILFPFGDRGWDIEIENNSTGARQRVSMMQFYAYMLAIRKTFSPILYAGKLTQQFIVDKYVAIEAQRLNYIKTHQKDLRVENYKGLMDHLESHASNQGLKAGKAVILPSTFQGSPRAMHQNYQDAMAIVRKFGKPDLFITMTCNLKWNEITENLDGCTVEGRPDLVSRVFNLKKNNLLELLCKKHVLGVICAQVYVIEFQKRGLPHAHVLLLLREEDKPKTQEIVDSIVSAEIPDSENSPILFEIVLKNMIHGPCGKTNSRAQCMVNGECSKKFPKPFSNDTNLNVNGYPIYKRSNGKKYTRGKYEIGNEWVVPYNPYLTKKFNCHINVEVCASIQSVKYLFKYVYKGHDCANIALTEYSGDNLHYDEVNSYLETRYISAPEAMWRMNAFSMHEQSHSIQRLAVHLPNEQNVYFEAGNEEEALNNSDSKDDTLTAFFTLNDLDVNARQYIYTEIPEHYTFKRATREWNQRKAFFNVIGRMYSMSVNQGEVYYLRLLLLHVKGPRSYEDLRTINGVLYPTFKEAAVALGLLSDNTVWNETLNEDAAYQMPAQLRALFAWICVFGEVNNVLDLWNQHKYHLIEDFVLSFGSIFAEDRALKDIEKTLKVHKKSLVEFGLPVPDRLAEDANIPVNYEEEYNLGLSMRDKLNVVQSLLSEKIITAIEDDNSNDKLFYVDGPGGSGKTFLYEAVFHYITGILQNEFSILCVASTGIAATILPFGTTYHSRFGLPVPFLDTSTSNIRANSEVFKLLYECKAIFWDEVTMTPNYVFDEVDRLMREITGVNKPFGGKVFVVGGDFRQILPVVKRGNKTKILEASVKHFRLWHLFQCFTLKENMRVDSEDAEFCQWLLDLGEGKVSDFGDDVILIPPECVEKGDLATSIFGENLDNVSSEDLASRVILSPKNEDVHKFNMEVLSKMPGEEFTYFSSDSIMIDNTDDVGMYPIEFLNSLQPSGTPPHVLKLKVGSIVMLMRNLNVRAGLCNGTRLLVKSLRRNILNCIVLTGRAKGQEVFIPRIDLIPSESDLPFRLRRRQFPVILAFAITINKSQGQTFRLVGIYLRNCVFTHGQLYVAFSRSKSKRGIKVKVEETSEQGHLAGDDRVFTKNCVYREIFQ